MNSDHTDEVSEPQSTPPRQPSDASAAPAAGRPATVVLHGEMVRGEITGEGKEKPGPKKSAEAKVSEAKLAMRNRLPALDDDQDVGVQKEHIVIRDGKADLAFLGTLLACAASTASPAGEWQEYRVYATNGGKHVFSKITRRILEAAVDAHEAQVFDPAPASVPSQLLRSARDLVHAQPLTWKDAAADFFGYDPLAKALYRKLSDRFEEHIS